MLYIVHMLSSWCFSNRGSVQDWYSVWFTINTPYILILEEVEPNNTSFRCPVLPNVTFYRWSKRPSHVLALVQLLFRMHENYAPNYGQWIFLMCHHIYTHFHNPIIIVNVPTLARKFSDFFYRHFQTLPYGHNGLLPVSTLSGECSATHIVVKIMKLCDCVVAENSKSIAYN